MKKQEMTEITYCDGCGKKQHFSSYPCLGCGVEFCIDCMKGRMVTYPPGVYHSGSDGYFCNKCDANPPQHLIVLLVAFRNILELRGISEAWNKEFEARRRVAEAALKKLQG